MKSSLPRQKLRVGIKTEQRTNSKLGQVTSVDDTVFKHNLDLSLYYLAYRSQPFIRK